MLWRKLLVNREKDGLIYNFGFKVKCHCSNSVELYNLGDRFSSECRTHTFLTDSKSILKILERLI